MRSKLNGAFNFIVHMKDTLKLRFGKTSINTIIKLRSIPIKQRIFLAFLLISILPVVLVGIYSNNNYEKSIVSKLNSYSGQLVQEISQNVKYETAQYGKLSETIIMYDDVQNGMEIYKELDDFQKNILYDLLTERFGRELFNYKNVKNISLRFPDESVFYDLGYEILRDSDVSRIISNTDKAPQNTYWAYLETNRGNHCIVLSRVIYSKHSYMEKIGYILIIIDEKVFADNTYKNIDLGSGSELFIMDGSKTVISSASRMIKNGQAAEDYDIKEKLLYHHGSNNNTFKYTSSGKDFLIAGSYIPELEWFIVGKIPYSFISSQTAEVRNAVMYASLLAILLSVVLSLTIYISVSIPLKALLASTKRIGRGNLNETIVHDYNDEISELSFHIKIMVDRLKSLIDEVKIQQSKKREAELKMLQAQINPHFLFNTLNSLKWSAMLSGNGTLEDGLGALSGLLKDTILNKDELITLEKEIDNLNNYSVIQRIRFGNSFDLSFDIEKGLEKCHILKFILQPIVENSIIHGIDEDEKQVNIKVTATSVEDVLLVRIWDNGKGFELGEADSDTGKNKLSGIGIANVDERIKLNFGEGYGLSTKSRKGVGTVNDIIMPLILREEEHFVQGFDRG